ncbi:hypothetical protein SGRI78S_03656 [Streptomyces griseus subsp. griseus]
MYCAWPPSRCGGTTIRRASVLAASWPYSCRIRCRQASIPAAVPAELITAPSSTYSTSGSTIAFGKRRDNSAACRQCVVQRRPSSSPAAPRTYAPEQTLSTREPRSTARRSASRTSSGYSRRMKWLPAGTAIRSASSSRSRPCGVEMVKPAWVLRTGPSAETTAKSCTGRPSSLRSRPNTSHRTPSSKGWTSSRRRAATLVSMERVWQLFDVSWQSCHC